MLQSRVGRQRAVTNENDENGTGRLTRAKAALQSKPTANTLNTNNGSGPQQRRRAVLGDVSNVTKADSTEDKNTKKAASTGRSSLVSKTTQHAGIQKSTRTNSSRSVLGAKDQNSKPSSAELKRPASGLGVMENAQ